MTLKECIMQAYLFATRKNNLTTTSAKYSVLAALADSFQKSWQNEPGTDWNSLYSKVDIGTISATDTFDLDDTIRKISQQEDDYITAYNSTLGQYWRYDLINPDKFSYYSKGVAKVGRTLVFKTPFISTDQQIGASLIVPAYLYVDDLLKANDEVQVDDPLWLVYMVAAEYVRNDTRRSNQYGNLINLANDRMAAMKQNNGPQLNEIPIVPNGDNYAYEDWNY